MKIIKLVLACIVVVFVILLVFMLSSNEVDRDIFGCYLWSDDFMSDKICISKKGEYQQFSTRHGLDTEYNKKRMKYFLYPTDEGKKIMVTLYDFVVRESDNDFYTKTELDIQPRLNLMGNVFFSIGKRTAGARRIYTKLKN